MTDFCGWERAGRAEGVQVGAGKAGQEQGRLTGERGLLQPRGTLSGRGPTRTLPYDPSTASRTGPSPR